MTTITDLKRIDHVIDRSDDRPQSEYWGYYEDQLIGIRDTNHECEKMLDDYAYDLLSGGLCIPATELDGVCGDCEATLDSMGLCGCQDEEQGALSRAQAKTAACSPAGPCDNPNHNHGECSFPTAYARPAPSIFCICGQPALIIEPHGTFCGACHEASDLWRLWKEDSTEFVAELRRQRCRLTEMAVRLATYLNAKNGSTLGTDSILTMWRQLLDDGEPPEPRYYVVARQQVAA